MKPSLFREIPRSRISFLSNEEAGIYYLDLNNLDLPSTLNNYGACLITRYNSIENHFYYKMWICEDNTNKFIQHLAIRHELLHLLRNERKCIFSRLIDNSSRSKILRSISVMMEEFIVIHFEHKGSYKKIFLNNPIKKTMRYFFSQIKYPFIEAYRTYFKLKRKT